MRALLIGLILAGPVMAGGVYKWTDADGNVHFGDKPPDARAERVQTDDAPDSASPGAGLRPGERAALERREEAMRERVQARQSEAPSAQSEVWANYCARLDMEIERYENERRRGCTASRCQEIDDSIELREHYRQARCR